MRKYVAFLLAFVLVVTLAGCSEAPQEPAETPSYSVNDLLLFQAEALSQQVAMSAHPNHLALLSSSEALTSLAEVFLSAVDTEAVSGKLRKDAPKDLQTTVVQICGMVSGHNNLALCSLLTKNTQMRFPKKLAEPAAVYLRYSEECHFVVLFTPSEDGSVSAWAYPLFADTAERVLEQLFADATDLTAQQIRDARDAAAKVNFKAKNPEKKVNADRYKVMAENIFSHVQPLRKEQFLAFTDDEEVIDYALMISNNLSGPVSNMLVYSFPDSVKDQAEVMLSKTPYGWQLEDPIRQSLYLSVPNSFLNWYPMTYVAANSLLHHCLVLNGPGLNAEKEEAPALVLMEYGDSCTVLLVFYPNQYCIYQYSFTVIPADSLTVQQNVLAAGLQPMQ